MKTLYLAAMLVMLLALVAGCDTELGHTNHDHDGDGAQDHAAEDHPADYEAGEEEHEETERDYDPADEQGFDYIG